MSKVTVVFVLMLLSQPVSATVPMQGDQSYNIPSAVETTLVSGSLGKKYEVSFQMNPFYLRGDFNGDGSADIAVLIQNRASGKKGIAIVHGRSKKVVLIGAGVRDSRGNDDYSWMDYWTVYPKSRVYRGVGETRIPVLRGEALHVGAMESASGLIYWNGRRYVWYQQGD